MMPTQKEDCNTKDAALRAARLSLAAHSLQLRACLDVRAGAQLERRFNQANTLMLTGVLDPSLPANNSLISSGELRGQFPAMAIKGPRLTYA
jgi:hypothetical protein